MTKLTFLGTGTSQGVPMIACDCWVCRSKDSKDKRYRSSVMVEQNGVRIIIDAGPDFRSQMLAHSVTSIDAILLTHGHKDHIGGLDDVRAFNYIQKRSVDIYCTERCQQMVCKDFDYAFSEHKYPGVPEMNLVTVTDQPFMINGVEVTPIYGRHMMMEVVGYRIGGIVYMTDFNYISDEELEKLEGIDILVINALRREKHISHYTLDEAIEVSRRAGSPTTYFTHLSHQMGRYEEIKSEIPEGMYFSYDGLIIESTND